MVKATSKPIPEEELKRESDIVSLETKDLDSLNGQPDDTNRDSETYVGKPAPKEIKRSETYIQERKSYSMGMTDQNKLKNTKLGDSINYYDNGVSGNGIVTKMSGQFIQIYKDDGKFYNININDTFHVSDILINKTWDSMNMEERTEILMKVKSYSPRFLSKTWDSLPKELVAVLKREVAGKEVPKVGKIETGDVVTGGTKYMDHNGKSHQSQEEADAVPPRKRMNRRTSRQNASDYKSDTRQTIGQRTNVNRSRISKAEWDSMKSSIEDGAFGNAGNSPTTGISTKIPFDAPKDYEGATHDTDPKQFKYEDDKPEVGSEVKAPEVKLDEQGLIKTGEFVYSDNPQGYKIPAPKTKGSSRYGIRYGVKYINEEEDN